MALEELVDVHGAIDPNANFAGDLDDDTALKLTVQDAETAESWIDERWMKARWTEADVAYQSPPEVRYWEGTEIPRSNVSRYTTATHLNSLMAQIVNGLFYEDEPFVLQPRPATSEDVVRAITAVQGEQLDAMNFREEVENLLMSAALFGTGIAKWGWRKYTKIKRKYKRKGKPIEVDVRGRKLTIPTKRSKQFEIVEEQIVCSEPYFENIDIRHVLVDPATRVGDIRKARFVIHKVAMTYRDLVKLREQQELLGDDVWDLPSEEEIRSWFTPIPPMSQGTGEPVMEGESTPYLHHASPRFEPTTADPLDEPLEVLERWTDERVTVVLNRVRLIRNSGNECGTKPFYSFNWWNIVDAFWGIGLGSLLAAEQRVQQGLTNTSLDIATMILNPMTLRKRGKNTSSQPVRQRIGGFIDVETDGDVRQAYSLLETPRIPPEIFAQQQQSEARSEAVSGANELLTMGNLPAEGRTSIGRTATGASALEGAASSRIGAFVERFVSQVFQPWLWQMHELNCMFLSEEDFKDILNDVLGEGFKVDMEDYLNASIKKFDVKAGSHLAVRTQMAQSVTLMTQLFSSPQMQHALAQVNGEYIDYGELLHMVSDMSGWKNYYSIVKPMTPEMKQQYLQSQVAPAQAQLAGKMQIQQQQHQDDMEILNQKSMNRAVENVLRQAVEKSTEAEAITGQPGNTGMQG